MLAWQAQEFGDPATVLNQIELPIPKPGPGEALVRVLATNIGLPDRMMVEGRYFMVAAPPAAPGQEMVGIVEEAGPGYPFAIGARVIGITNFSQGSGGLAEYCISPGLGAIEAPSWMADEDAAGVLGTFHVAYVGLVNRARMAAGETLLVVGGSGGTGSSAIQLGKALGATVIATARGEAKAAFCKAQGADHVIDLHHEELSESVLQRTDGRGADVVYDTVGDPLTEAAIGAIGIGGRYILIGFAGGGMFPTIDPFQILTKGISVTGALHTVRTSAEREQGVAALDRLFQEGRIKMPIADVVPFDEVPQAIAKLGGGVVGKLIARVALDLPRGGRGGLPD